MVANNESSTGASTRVSRVIKATREVVYKAFIDADAVASWLSPEDMKGHVHTFEPRAGGKFRMSLTYQDIADTPGGTGGKSSEDTDTFHGEFVELVPDEKIVWVTEFETDDPQFAGEMRLIWTFADHENGTEVTVVCEDIPAGINPEDNEVGSRSSLKKLDEYLRSVNEA